MQKNLNRAQNEFQQHRPCLHTNNIRARREIMRHTENSLFFP